MNARAQSLVVSGFLGSGKTTLVRRLLEEGQRDGVRTAVVSNEFGELGIDEAVLASSIGDFVELSGGCVCCRLSDDLLRTLQQLWERAHPERVIVETSGVALPYDTLVNFWRDPVREWSTDESSVVVVSAEQVAAGRELDAIFEDQVCSADLLVVSKTDLVSDGEAQAADALLRRMAPGVEIVHATYGDVDSRLFFPPEPGSRAARRSEPSNGRHAHNHDNYVCEEVAFDAGISESALRSELARRAALRAKGFVMTGEGLRLVQGVAGRIELSVPDAAPPVHMLGRVVLIERREPRSQTTHDSTDCRGEHR